MHYVYILTSQKDRQMYIGCTNNLQRRLLDHNAGKVFATKNRAPLKLIHYEAFINKHGAFEREQWLKTGWGRNYPRKAPASLLKSLGG